MFIKIGDSTLQIHQLRGDFFLKTGSIETVKPQERHLAFSGVAYVTSQRRPIQNQYYLLTYSRKEYLKQHNALT